MRTISVSLPYLSMRTRLRLAIQIIKGADYINFKLEDDQVKSLYGRIGNEIRHHMK